jgi:predicted TIM-barrel fold metal-dependent hydrolase
MIFLDDGFGAQNSFHWKWHKQFVTTRRLVRLEFLAESLIRDSRNWAEFLSMYRAECENLDSETIGLKSIAAYRCGLDLWPPSPVDARSQYEELKKRPAPIRITGRALIGLLVEQALQATERRCVPIQFHTGFGDPDLDLFEANPLRLRSLLEDTRYSHRPIVLLHAGYPYCREAAYLAAVYPQVYVDTGLALPHLSREGMIQIWRTLFEYCPTSKILYSSDAHMIPELFYLGARYTRETLALVLEASIRDGDLTVRQAEQVGLDILAGNSGRLYSDRAGE